MNLLDLKSGQKAIIYKINGSGAFRKRIIEMGFSRGKIVKLVKSAPLLDPLQFEILDYQVSLRREEAEKIEVIELSSSQTIDTKVDFNGLSTLESLVSTTNKNQKEINVVLVGNPNTGKTCIFNYITGSRENVGNYPGVTVDAKITHFKYNGYKIRLVDLPGTYSITAYTPEEKFVRDFLQSEKTDIVINVVDSTNLERNLYLTTQLLDLDIKMVISLNMYDELVKKGDEFKSSVLGEMIGVPLIHTVGKRGEGMKELLDKVIQVYENKENTVRHFHINYGSLIEDSISKIEKELEIVNHFPPNLHLRYLAIKLIEKDEEFLKEISGVDKLRKLNSLVFEEIEKLEEHYQDKIENIFAELRYGFISGALKETYKKRDKKIEKSKTEKIDDIFTHKILGLPIFVFILWLMFYSTFNLGGIFMEWIDMGVEAIGNLFVKFIPPGIFQDMLVQGLIGGVGGVIIFLPNIIILFLFIAILEGTGYMARIAFIMDRLMHKIGLHGKSFIPMIMGFGCNVPAIMATRTLENKSDRIITMLLIPLMSCSARLPVYVLLIAAFFPDNPVTMLMLIYFIGIILAAIFALIFKKLFFNKTEAPFVMELPPYRMPTFKTVYVFMWLRASQYLKKMGGIILVASMIIWALGYFPREIEFDKNYDQLISQVNTKFSEKIENTTNNDSLLILKEQKVEELLPIVKERELERHSKTYIGMLGTLIEPIMRPLGFDWRISIGLLSGFPAKEVIVSTLGVLFQDYELDVNNIDTDNPTVKVGSLSDKLKSATIVDENNNVKPLLTPVSAFALLIFVLIYFPCVASVVAIKKESGRWFWTNLSILYTTFFAWLMAFIVTIVGSLFF